MPKRICFLIHSMNKSGGTEKVCTNLANSLSMQGYSVRIATLFDSETFFPLNNDIPLFSLGCKSNGFFSLFFCLKNFFKQVNYKEYVICISMGKLSCLAALINKIRFINSKSFFFISSEHVGFHSFGGLTKVLKKLGYLASDKVVFLTEKDRNLFSKKDNDKYFCIPNFTLKKERLDTIERETNQEKKIALAVGRLCYQKNFQRLINLWQKAMEKNSNIKDSWELHIVGDGEEKPELDNFLKEVASNIKIFNPIKNISALYKKSSLFLMTSRYEGLPMVLIESQSHGLPAIAFDCPTGPAEIIVNNEGGYLINYNDDSLYIDRLIKIMSNDDLRENMSKLARKNARRFSENEVIDKWKKILK